MKVLVTGGAGYIGAVLVPHLLEKQFGVRVLDNLMYGGASLLPLVRDKGFEFVRGDVRDERTVREAVRGCDVVIHLAAVVGFPACRKYPDLASSVNVDGTKTGADPAGERPAAAVGSTGRK